MRRPFRVTVLVLALAALAALALRILPPLVLTSALHHAARTRHLDLRWRELRVRGLGASLRGVVVIGPRADTLVTLDSLAFALDAGSLVTLHPRLERAAITRARLRWAPHGGAADTLAPEPEAEPVERATPRAERLRHAAESLVGVLLAPARRLPRLEVRDLEVTVPGGPDDPLRGGRLALLALDRTPAGIRLRASGAVRLERDVPFEVELAYGRDDRIVGGAVLGTTDSLGERQRITVDGALVQDRRAGVLRLADSTQVVVGTLPVRLGGTLDRHGPRLTFRLEADRVTRDRVLASFPRSALGPLPGLAVDGSFDYRLALDLDLAQPDSVRFAADVIPHGLALDRGRSALHLDALQEPFVAQIHLPHGRIETREMSPANPFFRPLDAMDSTLVHAVLTNEDGGFFRHRGFNTEAIALAIAANVKAGAWRRGAGTVTMQLARNLWLGHARTLSRKAQEVVLAWVLEHLTGIAKQRLLEIYLNIIEWGPGVQGAAEATGYYFDEDPSRVTVDEALFLATVVPAPARWRWRFAPDGTLRPFERAQMHFIGRAMIARGWLAPEALPPRDSLRVTLRGPARDVLFPPAPPDSAAAPVGAVVAAGPGAAR
jgi:hypothetical protein